MSEMAEEEFAFGQQEASADSEHATRPVGFKVSRLSPVLKRTRGSEQKQQQQQEQEEEEQQQQQQQDNSPGAESTATPRRRVLFADAAGFRLSRGDSMEKGDVGGAGADDRGEGCGHSRPASSVAPRPDFALAGSTSELLDVVRKQKVALEDFAVSSAGAVLGTVRVHGSSRDKRVHLRWSRDVWRSHWEVQATAVDNTFDGETEQFVFRSFARPGGDEPLEEGDAVEMVVRYASPDGVFWDNNGCANYRFTCVKAGVEMRAARVKALVSAPEPNGCSPRSSNASNEDRHEHAADAGDLRGRVGAAIGDGGGGGDPNHEPRGDRGGASANGLSAIAQPARRGSADDLMEGLFKTLHALLLLVFLASLTRFGVMECCAAYALAIAFLYCYGVFEMLSH
ncbi:protein phosphatase 1 regulatory subunit 3A-like [Petromyzon marinus]|uniref:Protein phosphatase 1 regulatory subunit 3A-like n=1 Tax=Petromyzon marinus TaxID=7757 RepID=A0AAJ7X2Q5_PETMA|nr:protein phosphatase 1 regulatory subunit 3A-like [Petromyzon marinus]